MRIRCLLYVSQSCLAWPEDAAEVDDIVAVARRFNQELEVTGALIYTQTHFAQVLEGGHQAVETLMELIRADPRHRNVCVVSDEPAETRYFPGWSMAYSGPSFYLDGRIRPLLGEVGDPIGRRRAAARLLTLMREFAVTGDGTAG